MSIKTISKNSELCFKVVGTEILLHRSQDFNIKGRIFLLPQEDQLSRTGLRMGGPHYLKPCCFLRKGVVSWALQWPHEETVPQAGCHLVLAGVPPSHGFLMAY